MREHIVAAAVRGKSYFSGHEMVWQVSPPGRHCDLMSVGELALREANAGHPRVGPVDAARFPEASADLEQGFVTSRGRFVDRIEGKKIAAAAGQLLERASTSSKLFSEDVW